VGGLLNFVPTQGLNPAFQFFRTLFPNLNQFNQMATAGDHHKGNHKEDNHNKIDISPSIFGIEPCPKYRYPAPKINPKGIVNI